MARRNADADDGIGREADDAGAGRCDLCGRQVAELTKHHLIPRTRHPNKHNKKTFNRLEVKTRLALLCRPCHGNVHAMVAPKELERSYNTMAQLATHPAVARFTHWIRSKPDGTKVPPAPVRYR